MVSKIPKTCTCIRKQKATISTTMHLYQATICEKTNYYQKKKSNYYQTKKATILWADVSEKERKATILTDMHLYQASMRA